MNEHTAIETYIVDCRILEWTKNYSQWLALLEAFVLNPKLMFVLSNLKLIIKRFLKIHIARKKLF